MRRFQEPATAFILGSSSRQRPKYMTLYRKATERGLEIRVQRLFAAANQTWNGDEKAARAFLLAPNATLDLSSPIALAASEAGTRKVEELLLRVEHGVFA